MTTRHFTGALFAAALAVAGCSSESQDSITSDLQSAATEIGQAAGDATNNAAEALARNIATQQGEEQFTNAGHALDGPLTCTASITDGADQIEIKCTGTTQQGGIAVLSGSTSEIPGASVVSLEGDFVGTVDGAAVFTTQQLGG